MKNIGNIWSLHYAIAMCRSSFLLVAKVVHKIYTCQVLIQKFLIKYNDLFEKVNN